VNTDPMLEFAIELARQSGELIAKMFLRADLAVEFKADSSPVTPADRQAEDLLRTRIRSRFPTHGIVGEEFGSERDDAEYVWYLDPIDGTISFVAGVPLFGTLIGLVHDGEPILGLIHQPITKELLIGTESATTLNGRPVRVRDTNSLQSATLLTTDLDLIESFKDLDRFEALRRRTGLYRGWGDCYGYLLVATARADIMVDPIMNPWDLIPLVPVIRGAGGVITTWEGDDPMRGDSAVASVPAIHGQVLEILNGPNERVGGP